MIHERNRKVEDALRAAGIDTEIRYFEQPAPTAQAAAEVLGVELGQIANSLIFEAVHEDGTREPVLLMTSGAHRVDTGFVAQALGLKKLGRASAELVKEATGQVIGGVAPSGHPAPVATFADRWLGRYPEIWAAGGTANTMFPLTYQQLITLTNAKEIDVEQP